MQYKRFAMYFSFALICFFFIIAFFLKTNNYFTIQELNYMPGCGGLLVSEKNNNSEHDNYKKQADDLDRYLEEAYKKYSKKIDSSLLPLLDEQFLPSGQTKNSYRKTMQDQGQLVPAGSNLPRKDIQAPVDLLYLEVSLVEDYSIESIEPYIWLIINQSEQNRLVIAWVQVSQLESLAEQEAVRSIKPVLPPD